VETDRIRKVSPPKFNRKTFNPDFRAQAYGKQVFNQEFDIHRKVAVIRSVFPLGEDPSLVDADAQFRFYHRWKSG
jgi:hypothetical protein